MPTALVSVSDKTSLIPFCQGLLKLNWTLIASGGTALHLRSAGIPVRAVSDVTGTPEMLAGRVKTLHPAIYGGILARAEPQDRDELSAFGFDLIDMVIVNLYPFEKALKGPELSVEEAVELIDIGGAALIRAAAKNFSRVILACDPGDYDRILNTLTQGTLDAAFRRDLAAKGFRRTMAYDRAIAAYLGESASETLILFENQSLRYGENPHQSAELLSFNPSEGPLGGEILHGKPLSYNNLLDLDSAWRAAAGFSEPTVVIVKHLSPCGIATDDIVSRAYEKALASDPVSAFGSVIACNREIDKDTALKMKSLFIECIAAPNFSDSAYEILTQKKNLRLLRMPDQPIEPGFAYRSVLRGLLKQTIDFGDPCNASWRVVSRNHPDDVLWRDLHFAWKACQYVKSNAVVFARDSATVGIGGGQPNRVDCVKIACQRAGVKAKGAVMASDAFFPFPDSIALAAEAGIVAAIQPGGSIRDSSVIEAADEAGMILVMTGVRHFRH
jgi:phosphoribosylaminoimidazolecarboxamide formyltransferase/IMP cyclohydrolase